jgi:hypothetical protein
MMPIRDHNRYIEDRLATGLFSLSAFGGEGRGEVAVFSIYTGIYFEIV